MHLIENQSHFFNKACIIFTQHDWINIIIIIIGITTASVQCFNVVVLIFCDVIILVICWFQNLIFISPPPPPPCNQKVSSVFFLICLLSSLCRVSHDFWIYCIPCTVNSTVCIVSQYPCCIRCALNNKLFSKVKTLKEMVQLMAQFPDLKEYCTYRKIFPIEQNITTSVFIDWLLKFNLESSSELSPCMLINHKTATCDHASLAYDQSCTLLVEWVLHRCSIGQTTVTQFSHAPSIVIQRLLIWIVKEERAARFWSSCVGTQTLHMLYLASLLFGP